MCSCNRLAKLPPLTSRVPASTRPAPSTRTACGARYRYVQQPMKSAPGLSTEKEEKKQPPIAGQLYTPGQHDMCSHFRKPYDEHSKVTSRDKVYELIGCHIMPIQSVPCDYTIHAEWASQPMEQGGTYTRRPHRPYKYEFYGAEYWPWTTLQARLEAELKGIIPCVPRAYDDRVPLKPRDPPAELAEEASKKQQPTSEADMSPQRKARLQIEAGWHRNPWKKLWGATINDNVIIHCPNCNCYILPPVRDLSYLDTYHEKSSCFRDRGCYYSSYLPKKWQPPTGKTYNSDYGKFYAGEDMSYARPPINWWITEVHGPYVPDPPDYSLLSPSVGAPPALSIYEINSVSKVDSQWTP